MPGPDRGGRFEDTAILLGLVVRPEPGEFDVEHLEAGVGETLRHTADHRLDPLRAASRARLGATAVIRMLT